MFYRITPLPPQVRHRCRNVRCGGALKKPTDNPRDAFCCAICERAHYSTRCIVCEAAVTKKSKRRAVCWRSKCRHELQRHPEKYRLRLGQNAAKTASGTPPAGLGHNAKETLAKTTLKTGAKIGRALRHVAGPEVHEANLWIPPDLPVSKADRAFREYLKAADRQAIFQRDVPPANVIGGYRFPGAPKIDLGSSRARSEDDDQERRP